MDLAPEKVLFPGARPRAPYKCNPTLPPAADDEYTMAWNRRVFTRPPPLLTCVFSSSVATGNSFSLLFFRARAEEARCCHGLVASKLPHKTTKQLGVK